MATLSLEQVTKVFPNGVQAVRGFDLLVDEGEFVVLVGPSGCGKTTVLRMVAGLEEVTSGTIRLDDKVVNDISARDRDVAMVFQNYALYPHLDVLQNIAFSLRVRGVPKHERERKAREAADVLGLTEVVLRKPRQLSGGQRQRVAMGRALVREPAVFLMDEPLSNLDANLRVQMRSEVLRVQRRLGVATLYVTHDQTEAMTMGDRVAVLSRGTLQQLAAPQELYESPANLFVASFIGSPPMNLYEAAISGPADGLVLSLGSQRLALPADLGHRRPGLVAGEGRKVVVGIRPEHLTVAEDGDARPGDDACSTRRARRGPRQRIARPFLDGREEGPEQEAARGRRTRSAQASGDIAGASAAEGVARVDPRVPVAAGDRVALAVDVDRLHFFDAETGDAIGAAGRSGAAQLLREIPSEQETRTPTQGRELATFIGSETGVTVLEGGEVLQVDAWGESGARVRSTLGASVTETPGSALDEAGATDAQVEIVDDRARVRNGDLVVEVYDNHEERFVGFPPLVRFLRADGDGALRRERSPFHVAPPAALPPGRRRPLRL